MMETSNGPTILLWSHKEFFFFSYEFTLKAIELFWCQGLIIKNKKNKKWQDIPVNYCKWEIIIMIIIKCACKNPPFHCYSLKTLASWNSEGLFSFLFLVASDVMCDITLFVSTLTVEHEECNSECDWDSSCRIGTCNKVTWLYMTRWAKPPK